MRALLGTVDISAKLLFISRVDCLLTMTTEWKLATSLAESGQGEPLLFWLWQGVATTKFLVYCTNVSHVVSKSTKRCVPAVEMLWNLPSQVHDKNFRLGSSEFWPWKRLEGKNQEIRGT